MDFLGGTRSRNKELDTQDIAASVESEDGGHPRPYPFEVFRGLDNPDQDDAAGGDGSVCESGDKVADIGHLVGDANPSGKHHDCTVGVKGV